MEGKRGRRSAAKKVTKLILLYLVTGIVLLVFLLPIIWTFLTSIKYDIQAWTLPPKWLFTPTLHNYRTVLFQKHFLKYICNSAVIALGATILPLILGVPAAYALSRFRIRGSNIILFFNLLAYMIPAVGIVLPVYIVASKIKMLDTYTIMILLHSLYHVGFTVWMMRGFFSEVPKELEESAMVDGCSRFRAFVQIALPVVAPGLVATAIFCIVFSWNDLLIALIFTGFKTRTLPPAVGQLETPWGTYWGEIAACGFSATIPVFLFAIFVQRWMIKGLTFGAVKG